MSVISERKRTDAKRIKEEKVLKDSILKVLKQIQENQTIEFAVGGIATNLPALPGIEIPGYGPVSLPVAEMMVTDLRKHFHQAHYGLGEETLIDKEVRDSWQLDPEKFQIMNPNFAAEVKNLVSKIQVDLGCSDVKVTSHLYKLLLYEPGGHFKPHRDTEKHQGMFATLIIQVPSVFTGGDFVVKHGLKEKKIVFGGPESKYSCIYAAHYADCEHELTEITSGYRMALVYSLCWDGNGVIPSPSVHDPINKLAGLLQQVDQVLPDPSMIGWALDHQYSEKSFLQKGVQALKGGDKTMYSSLQGANTMLEEDKKLDFLIVEAKRLDCLYGMCTKEYGGHSGYGDCFEEDSEDDCEMEYEFKVISTDGKLLDSSKNFDLDVIEDVLNVNRDDDEFLGKCHEGKCKPSGNEGASKINWYLRYVLVIFPEENDLY